MPTLTQLCPLPDSPLGQRVQSPRCRDLSLTSVSPACCGPFHFLLALPPSQTSYPPHPMPTAWPSPRPSIQHFSPGQWPHHCACSSMLHIISSGSPLPIGQVPLALLSLSLLLQSFPTVQAMALCLGTCSSLLPPGTSLLWILPKKT